MRFGETVRALRTARNVSLRASAERVSVSFAYISKVENGKLDFGEFSSERFIRKIASALEADEEELLLPAEKSPRGSAPHL
jgi:HTH-type transcriptional regulator, competence development regulator